MPKTISSTEAQSQFGSILKWAKDNNDEVIVKLYGEPAVVLVPYAEYERLEKLKRQEARRQALAELEAIRAGIAEQNPDIRAEEAYREAGFSEEVIQETLRMDEQLTEK